MITIEQCGKIPLWGKPSRQSIHSILLEIVLGGKEHAFVPRNVTTVSKKCPSLQSAYLTLSFAT